MPAQQEGRGERGKKCVGGFFKRREIPPQQRRKENIWGVIKLPRMGGRTKELFAAGLDGRTRIFPFF